MTITIVAPPTPDGPDGNGLTWIRLQLSKVPSDAWAAALTAAGEATTSTDRPTQFYVEGDVISFAFNASAEPPDDEDHELFRYLDVVRQWIETANTEHPNG